MNYEKNMPVYYVPYVRFKQDYKHRGQRAIKAGEEFPIDCDTIMYSVRWDKNTVYIMVHDEYACNVFAVDKKCVELITKEIIPVFKIGDIVKRADSNYGDIANSGISRIWEYTIVQGKVWYRDGWSVATDCESGQYEDKLKFATTSESRHWAVEYNDNLVKEKKPEIYKQVIK